MPLPKIYNLMRSVQNKCKAKKMGLVKWVVSHQEFRCYEAKTEESVKGRQPLRVKPRTPLA